ncbi:MAG: DNA double-strand break repair nuclease NurA [Anaerolineae bacterium]|nr:DNA double-strand break repair nuclease NurA [Anaerolineae bacterium]
MPYVSRYGRRPNEYASKSSHGYVIQDPSVQEFLTRCNLPPRATDVTFSGRHQLFFTPVEHNPIQFIIAVDGGYNEVPVRVEFPSATVCFFQIGALIFSIEDLDNLGEQPFIDPADMAKLNNIQRLKFTLPVRNVTLQGDQSLTYSVRRAMYEFFSASLDNGSLMDTLRWFIFREYDNPLPQWMLATCPVCERSSIPLVRSAMSTDHKFSCPECGGDICLTDVFRLHEVVDDELGAGGILGYVTTTVEQLVLVHLIHLILATKPNLLKQILFIKDGPLAFFGQTANMYKPMRALVNYLFDKHDLHLAGLEKSGPFVEHADEIRDIFDAGSVLFLDNDYIYRYVIPGKADPSNPYGRTTYYSNKMIFKTSNGSMYVASIPTRNVVANPAESDFPNLRVILTNIEKLRCDMYDNALMPVALANKLVSLANHPSARILQKFAMGAMKS